MKKTDISKKVRAAVLERDSIDGVPNCIYCGNNGLDWAMHLHHVKRRSQGGEGTLENLVTICPVCHTALHNGNKEIQKFCEKYLEERYGQ